jgi:hypothetical protein
MAMTFTAENATEALILEQALAYARQLTRTANTAPDGHVLRLPRVTRIRDEMPANFVVDQRQSTSTH